MRRRDDSPRRVLVVAYDFPPHAAIGTMRTLRVVQCLVERGWDVTVLTSDHRTFRPGTPFDAALLERVPARLKVVRAPALRGFETLKDLVRRCVHPRRPTGRSAEVVAKLQDSHLSGHGARALDFVEAVLAIPDNESGWFLPAVAQGLWACRNGRPDVLYSSSPPWTGQLVARALAGMLQCPWVADFRDPWARPPWREARPFARRANAILERTVVRRANAVLFVTRGNLNEFSAFYGGTLARRFHLIPNGCDPSEFAGITLSPPTDRFVLLHAGTLYGTRNPIPLIRALARAINRGVIERDRFRLRLLGPMHLSVDLPAQCRQLGMDSVVEFVPRVSRHESLREMIAASALLLIQPVTTVSVPGKAYEYLVAGRPLLALAEEGETAEMVRASGIGVSISPDASVEALEAALLKVIEIASKPYEPPSSVPSDGRVHAATTADLIAQFSGAPGNEVPSGMAPSSPVGVRARVEDPRQ